MKDKKYSIFAYLIIVIFTSMLLLTCNNPKNNAAIEYISMWNAGEPEALFLIDMMELFEQETDIAFTVSWAGRDNLNKLRTRFLSGDVPDLIDQGFSELGALFQDEVLLQSIEDVYKNKGPEGQASLEDIFDKNALEIYKVQGMHYYFPLKVVTSGFFYDKKIFEKYNVEVSKTWEAFMAHAHVMKAQNFPPLALDGTISSYNAYYFYWAVQRILGNGVLLKAVEDRSGKLWLDNPGFMQAAQLVSSLSKKNENLFQAGYSGSSWPAAQSDWALNKSGSILVGSWIASETKNIKTASFDIGYYPFPEIQGGKGRLHDMEILPFGFAIPKGAKNAEAAKRFLLFISKKEYQEKFVRMTDNFSPRTDIPYPELLKDIEPYMKSAKYHLVYDGVQQKYPEWLTTVFNPLDNALISGQIHAEDFIQSLAKDSATYWKNKKQK